MSQATRLLSPFDFRSDFSPQAAAPDAVRLSAEELAGLIAKVRAEALAEVSRQEAQETLDRLDRVTATMRDVLADLLQLMQLLDSAAYDDAAKPQVRGAVTGLAQRLIDGQGDLFGLTRDLSAKLDKAPSGKPRMGA